jgi:hypothetical protein
MFRFTLLTCKTLHCQSRTRDWTVHDNFPRQWPPTALPVAALRTAASTALATQDSLWLA